MVFHPESLTKTSKTIHDLKCFKCDTKANNFIAVPGGFLDRGGCDEHARSMFPGNDAWLDPFAGPVVASWNYGSKYKIWDNCRQCSTYKVHHHDSDYPANIQTLEKE